MEHGSSPTNYPGRTPIQIVGRFAVLLDFPGFLILHQPPERYGTWFESDQVPWSDSRRPFSARSPLLFSGDLDGGPTRGVGRTPRYSITLWLLVRVRPAPPRSRAFWRLLRSCAGGQPERPCASPRADKCPTPACHAGRAIPMLLQYRPTAGIGSILASNSHKM